MKILNDLEKYNRNCIGCGYCCIKSICTAGSRLYPSAVVCPALIWSETDKRYFCNLMTIPGKVGEGYREELYAGEGCCSGLNDWRNDVKERLPKLKKDNDILNIDPLFQIFLRALGKEMISGDTLYLILFGMHTELKNKGCSEYEIKEIKKCIIHHIKNNRTKIFDSFIGEFKYFFDKK